MKAPYLIVRRTPYEEPYHTHLYFCASNGVFTAAVDMYCKVDDLADIGAALKAFPAKLPDEYFYEYGSLKPDDEMYRYFRLRFYTLDHAGHCAMQFTANLRDDEPYEGVSTFSFKADPAAINRLGQLFETFHKLQHLELQWSPDGGRLFDHAQGSFNLP
ncbi:hypothetical protein OVA03_14455 [Asticcacaulis sp. SL142]|uniref:hypothetical protein n=1 Tax=Asticcacaulis sp. SL142 TaxID=2995155 RepID=UPI00226CAADD|nr:hypothetical protein [Asticcacaulis sp. SL142]WAC47889.1 hypothetical protein OVA03_14455 [Asticcacaulis sp. SL142]